MGYAFQKKARSLVTGPAAAGKSRTSTYVGWNNFSYQPMKTESISTYCHHGWNYRGGALAPDAGGEMELIRTTDELRLLKRQYFNNNWLQGPLYYGSQIGWTPAWGTPLKDDAEIRSFGTKAIAKTAPTDPSSSFLTFAGELKGDGLPHLIGHQLKERAGVAKKAGSEYLNVEFGWKPLISDLTDLIATTRNARTIIDQYIRDSSREVRRRYAAVPRIDNKTTKGNGYCYPLDVNVLCSGSVHERRETNLWFSGCFKYYVPVPDSVYNKIRYYESLAGKLYGVRLTPDVLWELAPWSWAVDWFSNVGDVMTNISNLGSDSLVMRYGYAMRHQIQTRTFAQTPPNSGNFAGCPELQRVVTLEHKHRIRADPYGFTVDFSSFTPRQTAIVAALGLSRDRRR